MNSIKISPYDTSTDISQFQDSLRAAASLYRLEPAIALSAQIPQRSSFSRAEKSRRQQNAEEMISHASQRLEHGGQSYLLVTKSDIFVEGTNFIFGLADSGKALAVLSVARLASGLGEGLTPSLIQERILKEAAHEIGHLLGLNHCPRGSCLMSFSQNLEMVDLKLPILCEECTRKVPRSPIETRRAT